MTASVYNTDRTAPLRRSIRHTSDVTAVRWHKNAVLIATSAYAKMSRLWNLSSRMYVRLVSAVQPCLLSSVGITVGAASLLAAGIDAGAVFVLNIGTDRHIAVMQGYADSVNSSSFN